MLEVYVWTVNPVLGNILLPKLKGNVKS